MIKSSFVLFALALGACWSSTKNYRETWEPLAIEAQGLRPRLLTSAIVLKGEDDVERLRLANGEHIGWHSASKFWALRAGSTGGTHYISVSVAVSSSTGCFTWGTAVLCTSSASARPTRIAVFRVEPEYWNLLPPHLIPPEQALVGSPRGAVRVGCGDVQRAWGTVSCGSEWCVWPNDVNCQREVDRSPRHSLQSSYSGP
jgi:hypothetical protein